MQAIGFIIYMGIGLVQLMAVMAGIHVWWGFGGFFSFIIAAIVSYIPLLGTILGIAGAMQAWHWEWWQAAGLFFGGLLLVIVLGGLGGIFEWIENRNKAKI